ncbi:MAG: DeoR/GlpR transcriptional regulator [Bacilli bacterium]|nr:DeoR/GlpR transcriptional regulator [Bacilli bacterium]
MLPIERLAKIKEIVLERKNVKISELSEELNVSEMTIHRDIKQLVDEGFVIKTFGGVSLAQSAYDLQKNLNVCSVCQRPIHDRFAYQLILTNNRIERACCAHCGFMRQKQLGDQVLQAMTYDLFKGTTVSAQMAYFVIDAAIQVTCCQPQVLAFESKEYAEKFIKGFGGKVLTYKEAMDLIDKHMQV